MHQPDATGVLSFHFACQAGAPVEILNFLLQEHPGALRITDSSASPPIHFACQGDAPQLAVIRFLLEQHPEAVRACDNAGALLLHRLCESNPPDNTVQFLLETCEGSLSTKTNNGDVPLMVACKMDASQSVVQFLLRAHPDGLEYMRGYCNPQKTRKRKRHTPVLKETQWFDAAVVS